MLTPEQVEKAKQALEKKRLQDKEKRNAMLYHMEALADIYIFDVFLPYRVLRDLHQKEHEGTFMEVFPNSFYPLPGKPVSLESEHPVYRGDISKLPKKIVVFDGQAVELPDVMADADYRQQSEIYQRKVDDSKMDSGNWGYWYGRFLDPYDFSTFTAYDFFGRVADDGEEFPIEDFRKLCIDIQTDFRKHPENYNTEPVLRLEEGRVEQ